MATEAPARPRLKEKYRAEIAPALKDEFGYANVMQIPGLTKIVVNMGVGEAARDAKLIDGAVRDLAAITGQKPAVARAKKSIAQFKLREGMPIGAHVTLRGDREGCPSRRRREEGRCRQGGRGAYAQGAPPWRRLLYPVRRERGGADQGRR